MFLLAAAALVMLDPGHSLSTPGALGADGEWEHVRNERVVARLIDALQAKKVSCARTRADDGDPSLKQRAKAAAKFALLLSIHHDAVHEDDATVTDAGFPVSFKARGFSLHVRGDSKESVAAAIQLADALLAAGFHPSSYHASVYPVIDAERGIYDRRHLALLNQAKVPAVIVECGFATNPDDLALLASAAAQEKLTNALTAAIERIVRPPSSQQNR